MTCRASTEDPLCSAIRNDKLSSSRRNAMISALILLASVIFMAQFGASYIFCVLLQDRSCPQITPIAHNES
jgi:hypothetical protein